jgi:hypothetical protein
MLYLTTAYKREALKVSHQPAAARNGNLGSTDLGWAETLVRKKVSLTEFIAAE